jgi:hypothetical protein
MLLIEYVSSIAHSIQDCFRLFGQIDLKADVPHSVVRFFWCTCYAAGDWDDGDEVDECSTILPVINDSGLDLLVRGDGLVHGRDALLGGKAARGPTGYGATGSLKEAAVAAEDFCFRVARKVAECG